MCLALCKALLQRCLNSSSPAFSLHCLSQGQGAREGEQAGEQESPESKGNSEEAMARTSPGERGGPSESEVCGPQGSLPGPGLCDRQGGIVGRLMRCQGKVYGLHQRGLGPGSFRTWDEGRAPTPNHLGPTGKHGCAKQKVSLLHFETLNVEKCESFSLGHTSTQSSEAPGVGAPSGPGVSSSHSRVSAPQPVTGDAPSPARDNLSSRKVSS